MKIKVGETEYEATFNAFTPIVFSREFMVKEPNGSVRPKDIVEDVGLIVESLNAVDIPSIAGLLEIFYACIKTADRKFDLPFDKWVMEFPPDAYDLKKAEGWAASVMEIVADNFFPSASDGVGAKGAKKSASATSKKS